MGFFPFDTLSFLTAKKLLFTKRHAGCFEPEYFAVLQKSAVWQTKDWQSYQNMFCLSPASLYFKWINNSTMVTDHLGVHDAEFLHQGKSTSCSCNITVRYALLFLTALFTSWVIHRLNRQCFEVAREHLEGKCDSLFLTELKQANIRTG